MKRRWFWMFFLALAVVAGIALNATYGGNWDTPRSWWHRVWKLDRPYEMAFLAPIVSVIVFIAIHILDGKRKWVEGEGLKGYRWSLLHENGKPLDADSLDSAITRQGIQSAIGMGVAAALTTIKELWLDWSGDRFVIACMAAGTLGVATLLAMMSVLCYSHAKRWKKLTDTKATMLTRDCLVAKAVLFDHLSWYILLAGLLWAVAIADAALSIWANIAYIFCLYYYYFWWDG